MIPSDARCPHCAAEFVSATEVDKQPVETDEPEEGDLAFCIHCGQWAIYDPEIEGRMRQPTRLEQFHIDRDPRCARMSALWQKTFRAS